MRLTRTGSQPSENTVVKTGVLFSGCVFGRVGNAFHSNRFLRRFLATIEGKTDRCLGLWRRFDRFVHHYEFPSGKRNRFQLLLSTRASGEPALHLLDSDTGFSPVHEDSYLVTYDNCCLATYGEGKDFLDAKIRDAFGLWLKAAQDFLVNQLNLSTEMAFAVIPYCLCLWLSQMSLTYEKSKLEEQYGVGGVFHFIYQNREVEQRQGPAVYIFSALGGSRTIHPFFFRVVGVQGGLYVEERVPPGNAIEDPDGQMVTKLEYALLDTIARPDIALDESGITSTRDNGGKLRLEVPEELCRQLEDQVIQEVDLSPFYQFCGFGFTDPHHRNSLRFLVSRSGRREDIFGRDGYLLPTHQQFLERNFSVSVPRQGRHK